MNSSIIFLTEGSTGGMVGAGAISTIIYFVLIIGVFYFILIRPQKKQQKEHDALISSVEIGDSIVTSSGFYGVVIDVADEIVVVEFGSNKNCRIPMQKKAIMEVEKANSGAAAAPEESKSEKADKKKGKE